MNKKILILTAGKTGGHRSASTALKNAFLYLDSTLDILDYDSNYLFLKYNGGGEQEYITMTTRFRFLWKIFFEFSSFFKRTSNFFLYQAIKKKFNKLIKKEKPDVIISMHPCFVGSVIKALKKFNNIPFYVVILDPVKFSKLWLDKRASLTFVATEETKNFLLKKKFNKDKVMHSGFPVLYNKNGTPIIKVPKRRKKLLFVNPSQKGYKYTAKLINSAYPFDVDIDIVTGSDAKLKKYLEKHLPSRENLNIYGYVNNMNERIKTSDIILTKAGPNIMFEAIAATTPIIFTGHLLGQEEKNTLYATKRGYGVVAEKPKVLSKILKKLLIDEPNLLDEMNNNQKYCKDLDGAINIAKTIIDKLNY